jgi:hypothetical protein
MLSCAPDGPGRGPASRPHTVLDEATPPQAAYEAGARGAFSSPYSRAGAIAGGLSRVRPFRPCPEQRSAAVASGQQRSPSEAPDLYHCQTAPSPTMLPKLAVRPSRPVGPANAGTVPDKHGLDKSGRSDSSVRGVHPGDVQLNADRTLVTPIQGVRSDSRAPRAAARGA